MGNKHEAVDTLFRQARLTGLDTRPLEPGFEERVLRRIEQDKMATPQPRMEPFFAMTWRALPVCGLIAVLAVAEVMAAQPVKLLDMALSAYPQLTLLLGGV
ncbi:MAG: hypothetical protein D6E12_10940 [Desulfovibrio sp.]|nr:MAG: hypothetical protein D6E12_10940 [Desulfovibrio sp.]